MDTSKQTGVYIVEIRKIVDALVDMEIALTQVRDRLSDLNESILSRMANWP